MKYYLLMFSLAAVILTVYDKWAARNGKWRVPEKMLLWIGLLGGALAEWIAMNLCRHKTRHKRFMIGLPLMTLLHAATIAYILTR